jgi:hypothetical protein
MFALPRLYHGQWPAMAVMVGKILGHFLCLVVMYDVGLCQIIFWGLWSFSHSVDCSRWFLCECRCFLLHLTVFLFS